MENVFRITLAVAGIINFLPSLMAFIPQKMVGAYGIAEPEGDLELLLRHRAVLFAIVGGLMLFSAATKRYYDLATTVGLVSMVSFIVLFFIVKGQLSEELRTVMKIDIAATALLLVGYLLFKLKS